MGDLDFDELDKAVQSLTSGTPEEKAGSKEATEIEKDAQPESTDTKTVATPVGPTERSTARVDSTPPRRSSGRFMDVVHPSADMKTRAPIVKSRQGVTIAPVHDDVKPDPVLERKLPKTPVVTGGTSANDQAWPDPIDFHESQETKTTRTEATEVPEAETMPDVLDVMQANDANSSVGGETNTDQSTPVSDNEQLASETNEEPEQSSAPSNDSDEKEPATTPDEAPVEADETPQKPLESPFLYGAKVEKRPLGAFVAAGSSEAATIEKPAEEDTGVQTTPLPAELHKDLLALDSDETTPAKPAPQRSESIPNVGPVKQLSDEKPTDDDKPSVFDAHTYQQAISHPAKKRSGWLIVVGIVSLIVIGVLIGGVVYYMTLPKPL